MSEVHDMLQDGFTKEALVLAVLEVADALNRIETLLSMRLPENHGSYYLFPDDGDHDYADDVRYQ